MFPVLFRIGSFEIRSYGVMISIGILAGLYLASKETRRRGLNPPLMWEFAPLAVISGLLGARLLYVFTHMHYFSGSPLQMLNFRAGGLSFYGGFGAGIIAAVFFTKRRGVSFMKFADCGAPGVIMALSIGRLGCLLNGCCYGKPSDAPWAIVFTNPASSALLNLPLHPAQAYEAAGNLLIFACLWAVRKRNMPEGTLFFLMILLYSALRFMLEHFRADTLMLAGMDFAWTRVFFIVIMLVSLFFILIKRSK